MTRVSMISRQFHRFGLVVVGLALASADNGAKAVDPEPLPARMTVESVVSQHKNSISKPPQYAHYHKSSTDAPVMGNGDLGLSVGGEADALRFWINKNDFWRLQNQQRGAQPKLFGWLDVKAPALRGATYKMEQPLYDPETCGTFSRDGTTLKFKAKVMATANVGWIELEAEGKAIDVELTARLTDVELVLPEVGVTASQRSAGTDDDVFWLKREYNENVDINSGMVASFRLLADGKAVGWKPFTIPAKPYEYEPQRAGKIKNRLWPMKVLGARRRLTLTPGEPVTVLIGAASLFKTPRYRQEAVNLVAALSQEKLAKLHAHHSQWWKDYWRKSWIAIPQKDIEQDYYASLYVLGSAFGLHDFPPGLFGIWVLSEEPAWNGDYHLNYNHNAGGYGLYSANRIEQADVLTEPYLDFLPRARRYARQLFDCRGVFFPVGIGPKGIDVTYRADVIKGYYATPRRSSKHVLHHGQRSNASECLVPVNFRFRSTWDRKYAEKYYPLVSEAAAFWEDYLKFEEGRYVLYDHSVHEGSGPNVNGTAALGLIRMTFKLALDMSELLGVDEDLRQKRRHILDHLSEYPTWIGKTQFKETKDWVKLFLYAEKGKQWVHSNTLGIQNIFPAGQIGLMSDPKLVMIARNMIAVMRRWNDFNGTNSFYPAAVRIGFDPAVILRQLRWWVRGKAVNGNGMKHRRNPHGMESCTTSIVTVNLSLCMGHQGVLRVFRGWPRKYDAQFENLRAFGAFLVSGRMADGEVEYVRITSEKGRPCTFENPWPGDLLKLTRENGDTEEYRGAYINFEIDKGETILVEDHAHWRKRQKR